MKTILLTLFALTGASVHLEDGSVLRDATVLIENQRIVAVGTDVKLPPGTRKIDASGKTITAGFIDPATTLGLVEISGVAKSNDIDSGGDAVRSAQRADESYNPHSIVIPIQRAHGVTTVHTAHHGGLLSGSGAVYDLANPDPVRAPASMNASIGGQKESSRGTHIMMLRQALDDAETYSRRTADFERNRVRQFSASRLDLEALQPVLRGEVPLHVHVNRRSDIRTMLKIASSYGIRLVIVGGAEAWQEAQALAEAKVPVILNPIENQPASFDAIHSRGDAAAILTNAGVKVAISTFSAHDVRKLRQWAGNAVRAGLTHAQALHAITTHPADILGLPDHGRVKSGAVANLVVWSGDPFEASSKVELLLIRGSVTSLDHRQHRLFQRYRTLPVQR
ncbi:MAG: amidohydrolase family protein [Myxococcota bacterium]|nr:amidohydrolase family protein [Myxococcota bacterium]